MPTQNTMLDQILLSRVHYELIRGLVRTGACPNNSELAEHLRLAPVEIEELLRHRSPEDIRQWCSRHRLPHGEAVPLRQVARLARRWYGTYADSNWHKWTVAEAQDIFREVGLTSPFWDLGEKKGRF
jgi:hypothetical protein